MSFSYGLGQNPTIDYPRLLIGDTQDTNHIFEDEEITSAYNIQAATYQSGMLFTPTSPGQPIPQTPVSYLRVAALLLDALAGMKSRMAVNGLLDAKTNFQAASDALRKQANQWREVDDNAGAFMIIEQCVNGWTFLQRFYSQVQRQTAQ